MCQVREGAETLLPNESFSGLCNSPEIFSPSIPINRRASLKRWLRMRCRRAAMLRIGPQDNCHTPHARVHNAFLPLFESAIRVLALPCLSNTTFFWDASRVRIAPSPPLLRWLL